mgnify:CR=1 FL=1
MTAIPPLSFDLRQIGPGTGAPFAVFDQQDSGCVSSGVVVAGRRLLVKVATTSAARASLRNAIRFHEAVRHPSIVRPEQASADATVALVYPWIDGSVLNHATTAGSDRSALSRFRSLPLPAVETAVSTVLHAHLAVAQAGFVSVDFYDGAMLYNFDRNTMHLIDLDEYRPAPFQVSTDRLPGSRSYMAPEEWSQGALIDERTMVFAMGRTVHHLLCADDQHWRGNAKQRALVTTATKADPAKRFDSISALLAHWDQTRSHR